MAFANGYLYIVDSDASDFGTVGHVIKVNSAGTTASYVIAPDGSATSMKWVYAVAISANGSVLTTGTNVGGTTGVIQILLTDLQLTATHFTYPIRAEQIILSLGMT